MSGMKRSSTNVAGKPVSGAAAGPPQPLSLKERMTAERAAQGKPKAMVKPTAQDLERNTWITSESTTEGTRVGSRLESV